MRTLAKLFGRLIKIFLSPDRKNAIESVVFMRSNTTTNLPERSVEYCIVLGGDRRRAQQAARLYRNDRIKNIIVSGGISRFSENYHGSTEAEVYYKILVDNGVSPLDIIIESNSTNTRENIKFSLEKIASIRKRASFSQAYPDEIAIVTSDFHIKRALSLMAKFYPRIKTYYFSVDSGKTNRNNWHKSDWGRFAICKEYKRLTKL